MLCLSINPFPKISSCVILSSPKWLNNISRYTLYLPHLKSTLYTFSDTPHTSHNPFSCKCISASVDFIPVCPSLNLNSYTSSFLFLPWQWLPNPITPSPCAASITSNLTFIHDLFLSNWLCLFFPHRHFNIHLRLFFLASLWAPSLPTCAGTQHKYTIIPASFNLYKDRDTSMIKSSLSDLTWTN